MFNGDRIPSPQELGFPEKFKGWRPVQEEIIWNGLLSDKRFRGNNAPVGTGKTGCYMAEAAISGERTAILTATKGLMSQLVHEFEALGIKSIKGKANYPCSAYDDWTCQDGHHSMACGDKDTPSCPYTSAYYMALGGRIVITNYAFWIAIHKYGTGLGNFDHLVLDEAHESYNMVANAMSVFIDPAEPRKLLGEFIPTDNGDPHKWKEWAKRIRGSCDAALKLAEQKMQTRPSTSTVGKYQRLVTLSRKLATLALMRPDDWVVDNTDRGYQLDPVRVGMYAEKMLFRGIPKITFVSATIRPKTLNQLGIRTADMDFWEYPSPFPAENNRIYHVPTIGLNYQSDRDDIRQWAMMHDNIYRPRLDRKHITHVGKYDLRADLVLLSKYSRYMQYNLRGDVTDDLVQRFKRSQPPSILVSPSVTTGYDFPGKECECQQISKVPFPNRNKLIVAAREAMDSEYSVYQAIQTIDQAAGRPIRQETDRAETFILDNNIVWLHNRYRYLFSPTFTRSYEAVQTIPPPIKV